MFLQHGRIGRHYWMRVELVSFPQARTPVNAIRRLCRLVHALPPLPRKQWSDAYRREFEIGIQGGEKSCAEWTLDEATLQEVVKLGAQIELTIYSSTVRIHRD